MYVYSNLFAYSDLNGTYAQCTSIQYVMYIVHICTQYTCTMYTCTIYNVQCTSVYRLCHIVNTINIYNNINSFNNN